MHTHAPRERKQEVFPNGHEGQKIQKLMETKQNLNRKPFSASVSKETNPKSSEHHFLAHFQVR